MKRLYRRWQRSFVFGCAALAALALSNANAGNADAVKAVDGFWEYTALKDPDGNALPLTGVFLFKNGVFLQQAIMDLPGQPFEHQESFAHAGSYRPEAQGLHLVADQNIGMWPDRSTSMVFQRSTKHEISIQRERDELTLVFGSGTDQKFKRIGPGEGEICRLANGRLAFIDGYFLLVAGDERAVVTGYGKFKRNGTAFSLEAIRWAESENGVTVNRRDFTLQATFDDRTLTLSDGRSFKCQRLNFSPPQLKTPG